MTRNNKKKSKGRVEIIDSYIDSFYHKMKNHNKQLVLSNDRDISVKNLKFANHYLYKQRKKTIKVFDDKTKLSINGSTVLVYFNSLAHRLWDLMYASLSLHREGNYLSSLMIQRMTYETIAHSRFFLDKITDAMKKRDERKYIKLIADFVYSQDIIDDVFQDDVRNSNKVKKLPHIQDSIRYFKKVNRPLRNYGEDINKRVDKFYGLLSQQSHPNSLGLVYFYSEVNSETWNYDFSQKNNETLKKYYVYSEEMNRELVIHCDYMKNFLPNYEENKEIFFDYLIKKTNNKTRKYLIELLSEYKLSKDVTIN